MSESEQDDSGDFDGWSSRSEDAQHTSGAARGADDADTQVVDVAHAEELTAGPDWVEARGDLEQS